MADVYFLINANQHINIADFVKLISGFILMSRPDETLPLDVDVIVLGTGLPESILAAACARVGFTVLHLDRNDYYGGPWTSFNLDGIQKWVDEQNDRTSSVSDLSSATVELVDGERLLPAGSIPAIAHYSNIVVSWHVPDKDELSESDGTPAVEGPTHEASRTNDTEAEPTDETQSGIPDVEIQTRGEDETEKSNKEDKDETLVSTRGTKKESKLWTKQCILGEWRRFSLDLVPKILLGRGSMVELLAGSGVGRYAEFRSVNRLLTFYQDDVKTVPCSRSEVFQSTEITMLEKRMLMKFLTFCLNYDSESERNKWQEFAEKPLEQLLSSSEFQLTDRLRHYVLHALAMVSPDASTAKGLEAINEFLMSTGRYGSSPFLWTMYGSGEIPQCFCRLCAVFGGTYCLRRSVEGLIFDSDGNCTGVVSEGQRVTCRNLVSDGSYLPNDIIGNGVRMVISRAILIIDKPLYKSDSKENVCLLNYHSEHLREPVRILEAGSTGCVCPPGLFVIHLTTIGTESTNAKEDLEPVVNKFFKMDTSSAEDEDDRPKVLWSMYFNCISLSVKKKIGKNVIVTPPVDANLTHAGLVPQLKQEFNRLWPDTEFLPTPPNPDEASDSEEVRNDPGVNGYTPDV